MSPIADLRFFAERIPWGRNAISIATMATCPRPSERLVSRAMLGKLIRLGHAPKTTSVTGCRRDRLSGSWLPSIGAAPYFIYGGGRKRPLHDGAAAGLSAVPAWHQIHEGSSSASFIHHRGHHLLATSTGD